jgi:vancomycin permeability regulator SanA
VKAILIVLGNPPNPDGSVSRILQSRLDLAIALYHTGKVHKLILTGGAVYNQHIEAKIMEKYCLEQGVKAIDIYVECLSRNTYDNALYSASIVHSKSQHPVIVITSHFHRLRTTIIFQHYFKHFQILTPPLIWTDFIRTLHLYLWEIYLTTKLLALGDDRLARKSISP